MRLVILQSMSRWDKAAEIAIGAVRFYPDCPDIYLIGAYAIRRHLDVGAALEFLQGGQPCMEEVAKLLVQRRLLPLPARRSGGGQEVRKEGGRAGQGLPADGAGRRGSGTTVGGVGERIGSDAI